MNQAASLGERGNVLVVEDDPDAREMLEELFIREGYAVRTATNGVEAMQSMSDARPSVVLLDLMMPVMNGWEVMEAMQRDPALAGIPVVVLTGASRPPPAGPLKLFQKPIDFGQLLAAVSGLCS